VDKRLQGRLDRAALFLCPETAMKVEKAYSVLDVKSVDVERRIIEGIATTPTPDRVGDVIEPEGIEFKLPLPLLYMHNSRLPIGNVVEARVSAKGIRVKAQIAAAGVASFIDEAWALIRNQLVRGLSIGFRSLEESFDKELNGYRFLRSEWLELSAVTIPANADATILTVKSADAEALAAMGRARSDSVRLDPPANRPGVSGLRKRNSMKTIGEQIAEYEAKRAANQARIEKLMETTGAEGRVFDDAEAEEYDGLKADVEGIDEHLVRLRSYEKTVLKKSAVAVPAGNGDIVRPARIQVKAPELPKGIGMARYAMALARAKGNEMRAVEIAKSEKHWREQTPEVEAVLKAAVTAGTTTVSGWASQIVEAEYLASEFIEYLRPMTIVGRVQDRMRRVPFNVKMARQTAGGAAKWVGQGATKPVTRFTLDQVTLGFSKCSGIVVLSDELVKFSSPSAELWVRDELARVIRQFLDEQFIDPDVTAEANVSPASVTNGATNSAASGVTAAALRADFHTLASVFINANLDTVGAAFVMRPTQALQIQLMMNELGQVEFPGITADGGTLFGYQVVTSNSVPAGVVVFLQPSEILYADDGGVSIDLSREATVLMDDGESPASEGTVNLWQENLVGLRAERYINWVKRRAQAVAYLTGADYGGESSP
jgi:HK97 family phage major capsid protein/HK97 family phage prohead protease